jgi:drug/metabolite transporter (DMT)-like permease
MGTQYVFWRIKQDDKQGKESSVKRLLGHLVRHDLDSVGKWYIRWFSLIFSMNIAIGNVSLRYVSVNFNQVMRSLVPFFTIVLGILIGKRFTGRRLASVVPIIAGVMIACFGDMEYTTLGFVYTMSCVILAALKAVVAGEMLTGSLNLHPVDLLGHLAPLAMMQCMYVRMEKPSFFSRSNQPCRVSSLLTY